MFGGMKEKLQNMQQQMEATKARLETISVSSKSTNGKIEVVANANQKIMAINLDGDAIMANEIEELTQTINMALEQAKKVAEAEMQGVAQEIMPDLPGFLKK